MKVALIDQQGNKKGEIDASDKMFGFKNKESLVYEAITAEQANIRSAHAYKKTRAMVRGANRKPFRQKGTGNARQGGIHNPHQRGGGNAFGGQRPNYSVLLPRKMKKKAIFAIIADKFEKNQIKVVDSLVLDEPKTKMMESLINVLSDATTITLVMKSPDQNIKRATRNIPYIKLVDVHELNANKLLYNNEIIMTRDALEELNKRIDTVKESS